MCRHFFSEYCDASVSERSPEAFMGPIVRYVVVFLLLGITLASDKQQSLPASLDDDVNEINKTNSSDTLRNKRDHIPIPLTREALGNAFLHRLAVAGKSGIGLQLLGSSSKGILKPSATDVANQAAGQAIAAVASQAEEAYKAAQHVAKKIASRVSLAAQKAQEAAASKYSEAAQLTQAAQISQAIVFKEAAQAAQTGRTVQAAEAIQMLALSQLATLQQALSAAEAQAAVAHQVLSSAALAYLEQTAMLRQAQEVAQTILNQQMLSVNELAKAQSAAQKAQSAATKAFYKAHSPKVGFSKA